MYTQEQYERALSLYDACGSVTKTITQLGYPARRQTLYNWITQNLGCFPTRNKSLHKWIFTPFLIYSVTFMTFVFQSHMNTLTAKHGQGMVSDFELSAVFATRPGDEGHFRPPLARLS